MRNVVQWSSLYGSRFSDWGEAKTTLARNTDAEAGLPPTFEISSFNASRLDLLMARIGLSFERRMGRFCTSVSESGGVGGAKVPLSWHVLDEFDLGF